MSDEERAELEARRAVAELAAGAADSGFSTGPLAEAMESRVQRRVVASMLPGGLVEYWRLVEQEARAALAVLTSAASVNNRTGDIKQ